MARTERILTLGDDINTDDIIPAKRGTNPDLDVLKRYALEHIVGIDGLLDYEAIDAGKNFGCGSSREFAPIALKAAGIARVRARSFAEIFYRNSINIGLPLEIVGQPAVQPVVREIIRAGGLSAFNRLRRQGRARVPSSQTPPRPMTVTEKLLARASGNAYVRPGEVVFAAVDLAMSHDAIAGPVGALFHQEFGAAARVWDPQKVVFVADHFIQVNDLRPDPHAIALYEQMVAFARAQDCHLLDLVAPGEAAGICHVLLPERGFIRPGMTIAGTDSHTCTYGALGCFATGIGTTDMANLLATGDFWLRVPATIRIELAGSLSPHISAKDIMLFVLGQIGCDGAIGCTIEFHGSAIAQLPIDERLTLANMAVECGALCGVLVPDEKTWQFCPWEVAAGDTTLQNDPEARYARCLHFDLSHLEPQVARPPKPDRVCSVAELGEVPISRGFIGSCTGGKLADIAAAATVLDGQQVAAGVSLCVVPASQAIARAAEARGYLQTLVRAGAQILKPGCGACINAGLGVLGPHEVGVYATNRNFRGRSGDPTGQNYLASPRTVAISAVRGRIADRLEP